MRMFLVGVLLALVADSAAAQEPETELMLNYTADAFAVVDGGFDQDATVAHQAVLSLTAPVAEAWTFTGRVAATFGDSLSERAIGDVQGVQGAYAGGDAIWLYEASLTRTFASGSLTFGRLSSGDVFGAVGVMEDEFVNSAFSSNGGAISINTPGRLPAPASSWGVTGDWRPREGVTARGGVFLSDPGRATAERPRDLAFDAQDGVLAFGEVAVQASERLELGVGAWSDSGRFDAFDDRTVRGNAGVYAWAAGRLAGEAEGRRLEGFALVQVAPRDDRSLQPLAAFAGLSLRAPFAGRADDALNLAVGSGRFSDDSGLDGSETVIELNYRYALTDQISLRPDLQYVINPGGGIAEDALVAGVQLALTL